MDPNTRALMMGAAGGAAKTYVEDVFSTWLYTGNGSTQTITNEINLSGNGGLVWIKGRSGVTGHRFTDTVRGATKSLESNSTTVEATESTGLTSFGSTGFSIGADADYNTNAATYVSWTFRKAAKFFDVVTYTGTGVNRTIAHSLGSVPGTIIVKRTDTTADWQVYHRGLANTEYLVLNSTAAKATGATRWNSTTPTSTEFSLGTDATVNASGGTYVAYLFADYAAGFGDSGNDIIINCKSYTGNGSTTGPIVTIDFEPQWLLIKRSDAIGDWNLIDNTRGFVVSGTDSELNPNLTNAESTGTFVTPLPTGFQLSTTDAGYNASGAAYIYIAIRRGPMKTPTNATTVFGLNARTGTGINATVTGGQVADAALIKNRGAAVGDLFAARLTGTAYAETSSTAAQVTAGATILQANPWDVMDGVKVGTTSTITNASANTFINYLFRRAPGFFDAVTYTGTGTNNIIPHNLTTDPELIIFKCRSAIANWVVAFIPGDNYGSLNLTNAFTSNLSSLVTTSSSAIVLTTSSVTLNSSPQTYIAYLFDSCPGVSKVGSYTGTGTTLSIDCGFTAGARFVMIKRTDSTGDWYVWDTARGIIAANDPYILLNSTAAQVINTDFIDPLSSGFQISSTAPAAINANGGNFIYLAIA